MNLLNSEMNKTYAKSDEALRKKISGIMLIAIAAIVLLAPAYTFARLPKAGLSSETLPKAGNLFDLDNNTRFDVNSIDMFVTNHGSFAWDITTGNSGLFFPKGTEKTAVFASGLWIGCEVGGEVRVVVAEFSQEFVPGNMINGTFISDNPAFRVYKINRGDGPENPDWVNWPVNQGAPVDSAGKPQILGDQTLWSVYNDADPGFHSNSAGNSDPLGLEIQQTTFGFNRQGALGNTVFLKFLVINKGNNLLENTFVSLWSDPDLGGASDDLVGCDVDLSLGYCYNATNNDELYLNAPPAVGYDFFKGPRGDNGDILPMTSFNKYINGTDPTNKYESYNYMRGLKADGSFLINPMDGRITRYNVNGDPVSGHGWLDADPADRRFMLSAGPFTFAPGDTQEVVAAIVIGQGSGRLSSISALKFYDSFAQDAFNRDFNLPLPPPRPVVEYRGLDREIVIGWNSEAESYHHGSYRFEGYNLYQGESIAGPWKRIDAFDKENGVTIIFDEEFDLETGVVINKPVQFGSDQGIRQYVKLTDDNTGGGRLINAKPYYYGLSSYAYSLSARPKTIESPLFAFEVIPQSPNLGTNISEVSAGISIDYRRIDQNKSPATDSIVVAVVDPLAVTGHDYQVYFQNENPPLEDGGEVVSFSWGLKDLTLGIPVLSRQTNKKGDEHYRLVDGMQVKVIGGYAQELKDVFYIERPDGSPQGLLPFDWGGRFLGGGADFGANFFGSKINPDRDPEAFSPVEIQFTLLSQQRAYRYLRIVSGASVAYRYADFTRVPFIVRDPVTNRPLNVAFTEDFGTPSHNGAWSPDASETGGREVLFIFSSTYTDTPDPLYLARNLLTNADELDVMYVVWLKRQAGGAGIEPGDKIKFQWNNPGDTNDLYTFSTEKAVLNDKDLAVKNLDKIRVVPNPYFGHSSYELSQFNRRIKFINLPEKCTIRIFTLAGAMIRTLHKNDPATSILEWDILTENRLTPASGIYIYHIEAEGIGETYGKMAIFSEQERLNTF